MSNGRWEMRTEKLEISNGKCALINGKCENKNSRHELYTPYFLAKIEFFKI